MSRNKRQNSIPVRLASIYTCIFALSVFGIFLLLYYLIAAYLARESDEWLLAEGKEMLHAMDKKGSCDEKIMKNMREEAATEVVFIWYCIKDSDGELLLFSDPGPWQELLHEERYYPHKKNSHEVLFTTREIRGYSFRIVCLPQASGKVLVIAASIEERLGFLALLVRVFLPVYLLFLLLFWWLSYFMLRRTLRPVWTMTEIARHISAESLDQRIPVGDRRNELDELATTLNEMLDKIQRLLLALQEKNDDLAHQLRTPITRIRLDAELTLLRERPIPEYREALQNCLIECDHLLEMVNTMLDIAELEAGGYSWASQDIDFDGLLREVVEFFAEIANYNHIGLSCDLGSRAVVSGHRHRLMQSVMNVLDNAVKYTPPGGKVAVRVFADADHAVVRIEDTGIGIASEEIEHIFDRFYRGGNSRSCPGTGLGLSFTRAVIEAHRGTVRVQSEVGRGSIFTLALPAVKTVL